jgi:hypothetical protein
MEQLGLGAVARSWLGSDVRVPIFSEQLHALFGTSALRIRRHVRHATTRSRSPSLANPISNIESPRIFTRSNPVSLGILRGRLRDAPPSCFAAALADDHRLLTLLTIHDCPVQAFDHRHLAETRTPCGQ